MSIERYGSTTCAMHLSVLLLLGLSARANPQESVSFGSLPEPVQRASREIFQGDGPFEVGTENVDGTMVYELEAELDGEETSVTLTSSGNLVEWETELDRDDLPPDIQQLFDQRYPGQEPTEVERVAVYYYEFELDTAGGERVIRIYPTGRIEESAEPEESVERKEEFPG